MPSFFSDVKTVLLFALGASAVFYVVVVGAELVRRRRAQKVAGDAVESDTPNLVGLIIGFVTNFLDTLGIGSYATTTSAFRFWKTVPDEKIPGTMNVGHTLPTIVEAFIFTQIVPIEPRTLILMIAAAVAGAWLGAGVVSGLNRRAVQVGMGCALFVLAVVMIARSSGFVPAGGDALALSGTKLIIAVSVNFVLGALMTIGVGLYAPCMILVSLLGMSPKSAFPIMMGSCAFLMPFASVRFIKSGRFEPRALLGLLVGGIPAVLIAAPLVNSLSIEKVMWLVIVVVLYTATSLLRTAARERRAAAAAATAAA
jgi:uncharacterized membrane protein YfcA